MKTKDLGEGEWLYENVKTGNRTIKSSWEGLTKSEIKLIRKKFKEIKIRQGIPFTPAFLISFVLLAYFYFQARLMESQPARFCLREISKNAKKKF